MHIIALEPPLNDESIQQHSRERPKQIFPKTKIFNQCSSRSMTLTAFKYFAWFLVCDSNIRAHTHTHKHMQYINKILLIKNSKHEWSSRKFQVIATIYINSWMCIESERQNDKINSIDKSILVVERCGFLCNRCIQIRFFGFDAAVADINCKECFKRCQVIQIAIPD